MERSLYARATKPNQCSTPVRCGVMSDKLEGAAAVGFGLPHARPVVQVRSSALHCVRPRHERPNRATHRTEWRASLDKIVSGVVAASVSAISRSAGLTPCRMWTGRSASTLAAAKRSALSLLRSIAIAYPVPSASPHRKYQRRRYLHHGRWSGEGRDRSHRREPGSSVAKSITVGHSHGDTKRQNRQIDSWCSSLRPGITYKLPSPRTCRDRGSRCSCNLIRRPPPHCNIYF